MELVIGESVKELTELSLSPTHKSIAKQLLKIIGFIILDPWSIICCKKEAMFVVMQQNS